MYTVLCLPLPVAEAYFLNGLTTCLPLQIDVLHNKVAQQTKAYTKASKTRKITGKEMYGNGRTCRGGQFCWCVNGKASRVVRTGPPKSKGRQTMRGENAKAARTGN